MDYLFSSSLFLKPRRVVEPLNWAGHIPFAFWLAGVAKPGIVVELGTHSGNSFFAFCQGIEHSALPAKCYAVDTWEGDKHSGLYGEEVYRSVFEHTENQYGAFASLMRMNFDDALKYFSDGSIDLLHIDGMHTYEAVKQDFELWFPKLSDRSVVLFHDIVVREREFGVWKLWEELSARYPHFGFDHSNGLGVLLTGKKQCDILMNVASDWKASEKQRIMKSLFSMAGQRVVYRSIQDHYEKNIHELQEKVHELLSALDETKRTILQKQDVIDRKRETIEEIAEKYKRTIRSSSWRLTKPVRKFSKSLRKRSRKLRSFFFSEKTSAVTDKEETLSSSASFLTFDPEIGYSITDGQQEGDGYTYIPPRSPSSPMYNARTGLKGPVFSVVVPVYNTDCHFLQKMVDSVRRQWYTRWELILVDDASSSVETRNFLKNLNGKGIIRNFLPENRGISGATNEGIAAASGDYVVFLDHDDELTADCLYELARCIDRDNPDYIYSDEDKIAESGEFTEPHFKPDWSPDTIMSTMYVCHVSCVRRSLLVDLGGLRSEYDGCQDWDLILRLMEKTRRICHISKVLYHWRKTEGSIAVSLDAKSGVNQKSKRVREDALKRRGLAGSVEELEEHRGYFRVNYHLQDDPLISVIIPTRDNVSVLRPCLASLTKVSEYKNFELILIDNGSKDPSTIAFLEEVGSDGRVSVLEHDMPFNYSVLNNLGAEKAHGDLLLFLNDDTEVITPDWMQRMGGYARLSHIGAVGSRLLYPGGEKIQHAGILNLQDGPGHAFLRKDKTSTGYFMRNLLEYNWFAVTGACMMIERKKFDMVGGFEERLPVAYNDVELCMRLIEKGFYNIVCQSVELIHHESFSRGEDHLEETTAKRLEKERSFLYTLHPLFFQHDPYFNPNFHPNGVNFELPL